MMLVLYPEDWHRFEFTLEFRTHVVDRKEKLAVRLFEESDTTDTPFAGSILGPNPGPDRVPPAFS